MLLFIYGKSQIVLPPRNQMGSQGTWVFDVEIRPMTPRSSSNVLCVCGRLLLDVACIIAPSLRLTNGSQYNDTVQPQTVRSAIRSIGDGD